MKMKYTITLSPETRAALVAYGKERHINGGLSGMIEHLAYTVVIKAKESKESEKKLNIENYD